MTRVLIVDDNPDIRQLLQEFLSEVPFDSAIQDIDTCHDGLAALKLIANKHYNLVITDILMPAMDGLDFMKILRSSDTKNAEAKIIAISGGGQTITSMTALKAAEIHADFIISKPFQLDVLQEILLRCVKSFSKDLKVV